MLSVWVAQTEGDAMREGKSGIVQRVKATRDWWAIVGSVLYAPTLEWAEEQVFGFLDALRLRTHDTPPTEQQVKTVIRYVAYHCAKSW